MIMNYIFFFIWQHVSFEVISLRLIYAQLNGNFLRTVESQSLHCTIEFVAFVLNFFQNIFSTISWIYISSGIRQSWC